MTQRPLVLLIEDDSNDVELIKIALSEQTIAPDVVTFSEGESALKYLKSQGQAGQRLPFLILLDLSLPTMHGLEVLEEIRQNTPTKDIPVVVFTSSDEQSNMMKSYMRGATAYIKKHVDFEEFKKALNNLDVYWLL